MVLGVPSLFEIFEERFYSHLSGGLLEAFGKLFYKDLKIYLYPMLDKNNEIINSKNFIVQNGMQPLYDFFVNENRLIDIDNFEFDILKIKSKKVLDMIRTNQSGWEEMLPEAIPELIKQNKLFVKN